ncbi:hypothetical protein [Saccharospirillum mangrovi]|uniref:hypothetical protein n=1 Tax=Saccharospirillum mangrovi TaxID=2161747 RepID=UPI00130096A0|nr:hypothetical protein [Saccharospirillum mangrovi]
MNDKDIATLGSIRLSFFEKTSIRLLKNRRCLRVCARRNVLVVKTTKPLGVADNEWIFFFRILQNVLDDQIRQDKAKGKEA